MQTSNAESAQKTKQTPPNRATPIDRFEQPSKEVKKVAKGDGNIRKVMKDGKQAKDSQGRLIWEVRVSSGWDAVKRQYGLISRRVHGTKADARRKRDELRNQVERGIDPNAGKVPFDKFASDLLKVHIESDGLEANTVKYYDHLLKRVKPYIGSVAIQDVKPQMLDNMYCSLRADGLSNTTVRKVHTFVKRVFAQAVNYDAILKNPADRVKTPKNDPVNRRSLTVDEAAALLDSITMAEEASYEAEQAKESRRRDDGSFERGYIRGVLDISCCVAARLGLATGMRRGEVLALVWDDIDFEEGALYIQSSITVDMEVKAPKSESGKRTIMLDAVTIQSLKRWQKAQKEELGKIGVKAKGSTPVCCDSTGGNICPNNFSRWWRAFVKDSGFDGLRFHELRHTQATLLLAQGVDVKTVQTRLGHADASITLNTYAHPSPENDRAAADMLGKLLTETSPKGRVIKFAKSA